ncbi:MAG: hypothetical protein N3A66_02115, partial [Planctomycetota bacterium]|nr:hypothetical protein [Planctomycetota bacterium]
YHVELCPSKPGGLDAILASRRQMLEAFRNLDLGFAVLWPYDQGGCTCRACAPWGANGFLRTAPAVASLVREYFPGVKIVLSTWYFDRFTAGEWSGLAEAFARQKPDWVDYLLADDYGAFPAYPRRHGVPGGLPLLNFPEISMFEMFPWGGFGANPLPAHLQNIWQSCRDLVAGGFPYSEGIFEDINKVISLGLYWEPQRPAAEILAEYLAYEFSAAAAPLLADAVALMESGHGHGINQDAFRQHLAGGGQLYRLTKTDNAAACLAIVRAAEKKIPAAARRRWRWRIFRLRAELDAALAASAGRPTVKTERCFRELTEIYSARCAEAAVAPPALSALRRF